MNGRCLLVSERRGLEGALIGTGFPFRPDQMHAMDGYLNMFKAVASQTAGLRRAGSAALSTAIIRKAAAAKTNKRISRVSVHTM